MLTAAHTERSARPRFHGRLHAPGTGWHDLTHLRAVGDKVWLLPAWSEGSPTVSHAFDRQVRAFGEDGQQILGRLRVGVVGAGGTRSAVIEQLIRLGFGELDVLDDQALTITPTPPASTAAAPPTTARRRSTSSNVRLTASDSAPAC